MAENSKKATTEKSKKEVVLELSEEQYEQMMMELDDFDEKFYEKLAGTANHEVVPTMDEKGSILTDKHYALIKRECNRYGLKILYAIDIGRSTVIINPETMKIGIINSEAQIH